MRKRSWPIRLFALSGLALMALGGVAVVALPAGAAYACPQCYGLKPVGGRIYVERSMVAAEIAELRSVVAEAEARVRVFFWQVRSDADSYGLRDGDM